MIEEMTSTVEDAVAETTLMDEAAAGPSPEPDARDEEIAALKDRLLRAAAETENMRRRLERDRDEGAAYAMTGFARDLLTVADNLARAIAAAPESVRTDVAVKGLAEGVEATERELHRVLQRHGVTRVDALGQPLDPNRHQAMLEVESAEHAPGTVVAELQAGYSIKDRLLRPSLVSVAKARA
jgi:molecular chaperone GrpE